MNMLYDNVLIDVVGLVVGLAIIAATKRGLIKSSEWIKTPGWVLIGWCGAGILLHFLG